MSKLNELIKNLCPDGVEYKKISEVTDILRGKRLTKSQLLEDGLYPVYHGSLSPLGYYNEANRESDTVIVVNTGGIGGVGYSATPFWCSDGCFCIAHCKVLINKFIYYYLIGFQDYFISRIRAGGVPTIDKDTVGNIKIPVPPIEVQREIVRILDNFTELTTELTTELAARQKQYEYYRDQLLEIEGEIKKLGEVCDIGDGLHGTPKYDVQGEIYFINGNNVKGGIIRIDENTKRINVKEYNKLKIPFDNNTIFLSINGTIGNVAIYSNENIALGKSVAYFNIITDELNSRYLFYLLQSTKVQIYFKNSVTGGTIKNLGLKALREYRIAIPPIAEQGRIVSILDRFDKLCNDLTQGLPAEIEARKKQYEYYRDKLLSFKEKVV